MKRILTLCCFLLPASVAFALETPASTISISRPTEVPGMTLDPGSYSIRIMGKFNDRVILKVTNASGAISVDFLGIPNPSLTGSPGITSWSQPVGGSTYLRGWVPPGSSSVIEFVYPKADAVSIAAVNQAKVPAIDPESEGRRVDPALSTEDMKLVTLWLLSSTHVDPSDPKPSIKAERYNTASYVQPKPALAALPHTASSLPLVLLTSLLSLAAAFLLRLRRWRLLKLQQHGTA